MGIKAVRASNVKNAVQGTPSSALQSYRVLECLSRREFRHCCVKVFSKTRGFQRARPPSADPRPP